VAIAPDGATALHGLYAAGDVTGGLHGAKRVAGNTFAGALVFAAAAGESMAAAVNPDRGFADPDPAALEIAESRAFAPLDRRRADLASVRARLAETMSADLGPRRDAEGLKRARHALNNLAASIAAMGVPDPQVRDNPDWQDRLDLENLVLVSRAIGVAAQADDWDAGGLHTTLVRAEDERLVAATEPVAFTRVRPGESLLPQAAE
jgi:fumarate reductase flavoprotein subunit